MDSYTLLQDIEHEVNKIGGKKLRSPYFDSWNLRCLKDIQERMEAVGVKGRDWRYTLSKMLHGCFQSGTFNPDVYITL